MTGIAAGTNSFNINSNDWDHKESLPKECSTFFGLPPHKQYLTPGIARRNVVLINSIDWDCKKKPPSTQSPPPPKCDVQISCFFASPPPRLYRIPEFGHHGGLFSAHPPHWVSGLGQLGTFLTLLNEIWGQLSTVTVQDTATGGIAPILTDWFMFHSYTLPTVLQDRGYHHNVINITSCSSSDTQSNIIRRSNVSGINSHLSHRFVLLSFFQWIYSSLPTLSPFF